MTRPIVSCCLTTASVIRSGTPPHESVLLPISKCEEVNLFMTHNRSSDRSDTFGFVSLLVTQFFGAANDNLLKQVLAFMVIVGGVWENKLGEGGQGWVSLCLTVPFILFSGYAGQLADRVSKSRIVRWMKIIEIPIAIVAGIGFATGNLHITLIALVGLALQSTFFGPAKYGMIPELMAEKDLSRANGYINMFTNIAIIGGIVLAGFVSDVFWPEVDPVTNVQPDGFKMLPLIAMVVIAICGLMATLKLPALKAQDEDLKFDWNPVGTYWESVREMAKTPLLVIACGWAFFYLLGMMGLLALVEYKDLLGVTAFKASILNAILAVAIGIGSVVAGIISGDQIRPILVRFGAFGLTLFFLLLGTITANTIGGNADVYYWVVAAMLTGLGISAGFYIIPLQALLQDLSPSESRGRFLGTTNAISFVFTSAAGLMYIVLRDMLHVEPNRVFLVCAGLSVFGIVFTLLKLKAMRQALYDHVAKRQVD